MDTSKDKMENEVKGSSLILKEIISEEKLRLLQEARTIANNEIVFYGFKEKVYAYTKWKIDENKENANIRLKPLDDINKYSLISNMNNYIYQIGIGHVQGEKYIEFYDENLELLTSNYDLPENISNNEMILSDAIGGKKERRTVNATEIATIEDIEKGFVIKGASPVGKHTKLGDKNVYGVVVVSRVINKKFLHEIKNKTGKELIIVKQNKIYDTTFDEKIDFSNIVCDMKENENDFYFKEIKTDENLYDFSFMPIYDYSEKLSGYIGIGEDFKEIKIFQKKSILTFLKDEMIAMLIILVIFLFISSREYKKFNKILTVLSSIKEGNYKERLEKFDRKEFKLLASGINLLAESVDMREQELKNINYNLEEIVKERTGELKKINESMKNILDNAGQGFLIFNINKKIKKGYSMECENIFGRNISEVLIDELLYDSNKNEDSIFFEENINDIFKEENPIRRNSYISLMPEIIKFREKILNIEYKFLECCEENKDNHIMMIITDITEKKKLESMIESEKSITDMIISIVKNKKLFKSLINEYNNFVNKDIKEKINSMSNTEEILSYVMIKIHTFKGSFSQMGMYNTYIYLSQFEERLHFYKNNEIPIDVKELKIFLKTAGFIIELQKDIDIIEKYLGKDFIDKENKVEVERDLIDEIINNLMSNNEEKIKESIERLKKIKNSELRELIEPYKNYIVYLSKKYEKALKELNFDIEKIVVDTILYENFFKSLVHIFNNIFSHGIESEEERMFLGKEKEALIECSLKKIDEEIVLTIKEDGRGIDFEAVREKLLKKSNYDLKKISKLTNEDLKEIIMSEDFTTKSTADELAGRGVGLYAVKQEIEKLGGRIEIETTKHKGTKFIFYIPYR